MSDIATNPVTRDWVVENNRLKVVPTRIELYQQRLYQRLNTFTDTLFTDTTYGIDFDLMRSTSSKTEFDQHIKGLVLGVNGIKSLQSFSSTINNEGIYEVSFTAITTENEDIPVSYVVPYNNPLEQEGIWYNGKFNAFGVFDSEEITGSN